MLAVKAAHLMTVGEQQKDEEVGPENSIFSKGMLSGLPSLLSSSLVRTAVLLITQIFEGYKP